MCPDLELRDLSRVGLTCRLIDIRLAEFTYGEKSETEIAKELREANQFFLPNGKVNAENYQTLRALSEKLKDYPDMPQLLRRLRNRKISIRVRRRIAKKCRRYFEAVANECDWRCRNDMAYGPPASITRKLLQAL